tara:strand:- start:6243 stop:6482 length:240 start_codon:yes stop_codon:yes gene_type:complete
MAQPTKSQAQVADIISNTRLKFYFGISSLALLFIVLIFLIASIYMDCDWKNTGAFAALEAVLSYTTYMGFAHYFPKRNA